MWIYNTIEEMKFTDKLHENIQNLVKSLQLYTDRIWYAPLIGLLAALDNLLIIIPTDGILVSSTMLRTKSWILFAVSISVGSTLGAMALAAVVELKGLPWILEVYPGLDESLSWTWTMQFFEKYGMFLVFFVAATPLMQHPAVILASLANTPLMKLAIVILSGRMLKYLIMGYIASHAPRLLKKMWGLGSELEDAGVKIK